jgi:shikimate kinase
MNGDVDNIRKSLRKPIVMVGLMGAGKTKIGELLAKALGLPFVDADHEIEATAGCTISDIFEQYGEPAFRDLERKVIARLMSDQLRVIATGGGAVMNEQTASLIWSSSIAIWIKADLDILVERTSRNNKRPLLQNGDPRAILQGLMDNRYPVYASAPVIVETDAGTAEGTLDRTVKALAEYLAAQDNHPR